MDWTTDLSQIEWNKPYRRIGLANAIDITQNLWTTVFLRNSDKYFRPSLGIDIYYPILIRIERIDGIFSSYTLWS